MRKLLFLALLLIPTLVFPQSSQSSVGKRGGSFANPVVLIPQVFVVADDGAGTAASGTLTPTSSTIGMTCSDANGCNITLGETGIASGSLLIVVNLGTNACNFAESAGVQELNAALAVGQYDAVIFAYASDRWVQIAPISNN